MNTVRMQSTAKEKNRPFVPAQPEACRLFDAETQIANRFDRSEALADILSIYDSIGHIIRRR